jgi:hypothetical protein
VWFVIAKRTEEVYEEWMVRVSTRFDYRVAQTIAQNTKPNLQACAHKYREELSTELVLRMTQLWVWARHQLKGTYSSEKLVARMAEWRRGALDADLVSHCKLMDKVSSSRTCGLWL